MTGFMAVGKGECKECDRLMNLVWETNDFKKLVDFVAHQNEVHLVKN